eukprot:m.172305 g.172305  ORF g.172305 m.172305 type:complete len:112 (-) comp13500_c1_seq48:1469-1804(-)
MDATVTYTYIHTLFFFCVCHFVADVSGVTFTSSMRWMVWNSNVKGLSSVIDGDSKVISPPTLVLFSKACTSTASTRQVHSHTLAHLNIGSFIQCVCSNIVCVLVCSLTNRC